MDVQQVESIGERLRNLGHDRREVVEQFVQRSQNGLPGDARAMFERLDEISANCIGLMEEQRHLIAQELKRVTR